MTDDNVRHPHFRRMDISDITDRVYHADNCERMCATYGGVVSGKDVSIEDLRDAVATLGRAYIDILNREVESESANTPEEIEHWASSFRERPLGNLQ